MLSRLQKDIKASLKDVKKRESFWVIIELSLPLKTQKKKKNLVNLGCAVDILTGKAPETALQKKKESQNEVNLLADFEDNEETKVEQKEKEPSVEDSSEKEEKEEGVEEEKITSNRWKIVAWIENWLKGRKQRVVLDGKTSDSAEVC